MSWVLWGTVGACLGWWAELLFCRAWHPLQTHGRIVRASFWVVLVVVVFLAAGQFFDLLPTGVYKIKGFLLSPSVLALTGGFVAGFWASRNRDGIGKGSRGFFKALLGTKKKSPWALQSVVAIVALSAVILMLKPDLLEHLESFKAGDVEAKFSSVSTTTREVARMSLSDISREVTVGQWIDFKKNFLSGAREDALEYDGSSIQGLRKDIRNLLFTHYVEPLAILLGCLKKDDRLDEVRRRDDLIALAITFRNAILFEEHGVAGIFDSSHWENLIDLMNEEIKKLSDMVEDQIPPSIREQCRKYGKKTTQGESTEWEATIVSIRELIERKGGLAARKSEHLKKLLEWTSAAIDKLKSSVEEANYKLSYIDPYVVSAVSDFVALTLGHNEKANFLTEVKDKYPREMKFIQPGIINLYYQLSDAKVKAEAAWPLDEKIAELDYAMKGADLMVVQSRQRLKETSPKALALRGKAPDKSEKYNAIIGLYFRNKIVLTSRYIEVYYLRSLAGDTLSEPDRIKWIHFYRQAEGILNLNSVSVKLTLKDSNEYALATRDVPDLSRAVAALEAGFPQVLFDIRIGMALSSIMLTEENHKSSNQACALSDFYLRAAKDMIPDLAKAINLERADSARLRGYILQVQARIDASC
jgi:hypothetical protein